MVGEPHAPGVAVRVGTGFTAQAADAAALPVLVEFADDPPELTALTL